eukprot:TRINITY_DN8385_c0_g3_i2.p1 TRINITY_DN8385_c0_g3~~TRINITY_DN8385_c0_g3_i2.p1  ORF type:complete len:426 (+),score=46.03 TRINITY_DN8385_c0_g3_i2:749-2026(+)
MVEPRDLRRPRLVDSVISTPKSPKTWRFTPTFFEEEKEIVGSVNSHGQKRAGDAIKNAGSTGSIHNIVFNNPPNDSVIVDSSMNHTNNIDFARSPNNAANRIQKELKISLVTSNSSYQRCRVEMISWPFTSEKLRAIICDDSSSDVSSDQRENREIPNESPSPVSDVNTPIISRRGMMLTDLKTSQFRRHIRRSSLNNPRPPSDAQVDDPRHRFTGMLPNRQPFNINENATNEMNGGGPHIVGLGAVQSMLYDFPESPASAGVTPKAILKPGTNEVVARKRGSLNNPSSFRKALGIEPIKVLVVDDDAFNIYAIKEYLKLRNFQVEAREDALTALKYLKENHGNVDVVISDWLMAPINGDEFCEKTREFERESHLITLPFVCLSGNTQDSYKRRATEVGFTRYLVKPLPMEDLVGIIREVVPRAK